MSHYAMERGWQDHPIFEGDEYSRRDAWEWLIANAAWQDKRTRVNGQMTELKRGQLSYSFRFLADKWGWSLGKVQRFLKDLKNESMIDTQSDTGQLIITIENYDKFQVKQFKRDTATGTRTDTAAIQERYKDKEGNKIILGSEAKASSGKRAGAPAPPEWLHLETWQAFGEMRRRIKKPLTPHAEKLAFGKLDEFRAKGHDPTEILNYSILNDYPGLYEPKGKTNGNAHRTTDSPKSQIQRAIEATERARAAREQRSAEQAG